MKSSILNSFAGRAAGALAGLILFTAPLPGLAEGLHPIQVLFLGDNDLHRPAERFAQLEPVLAPRGIRMVYSARLDRGIRWTAGAPMQDLQAKPGKKPFEYMEAPDRLPNYIAGADWGTQGEPIRTMQKPLSPEASGRRYVTHPGFSIELFAAEPQITKPICMGWDERGRLWLAETVDYPNDLQPPGRGNDRIKICEDTNGDGRADTFTVFADRLSIPTSFVFADGGIIVSQAPDMLFLKDTTGDDRADVREVLFTGWGVRDTHAGPSNLRYGLDNWIWGVVGYSGFEGTVGGKRHRFGMGIFRFRPDGSELEFIRSSNNNTWGLGISEEGIIFGSTANDNPSMYMAVPNRYYEAVRGWSASRLETIATSPGIYPITEKVRQVDWHDRYTAGAGHALYTARSFPKEFWNRIAFVAEPTGHLLGQFVLESSGADFVARNARNFLASDDEWASPIAAEVGPDGAVWMLDWYNYIIQHNPTPVGFETGKGNAYETSLRDKHHGRVYRISWKGSTNGNMQHPAGKQAPLTPHSSLPAAPALKGATSEQLVNALKNDNQLWRLHAQRMLVERGQKDIVPALLRLAGDTTVDAIGLNPAAIHALWTLHGLGVLDGSDTRAVSGVVAALEHPSAGVRRAAVNVLPRTAETLDTLLNGRLLDDPDAQVRLAALLALSEIPGNDRAGAAIYAMLQEPANSRDRWISDGAVAAAARHDLGFLNAALVAAPVDDLQLVAVAPPAVAGREGQVVRLVAGHYARGGKAGTILPLLTGLKKASPAVSTAVLDGLVAGWPEKTAPQISAADEARLGEVMQSLPENSRDRLLALGRRWGRADIFAASAGAITGGLKQQVADAGSPDEQRGAAARRWLGLEDNRETVGAILDQISIRSSPTLTGALISALGESRNPETGSALVAHWTKFGAAARRTAIGTLARRGDWANALFDAIEGDVISRVDLAQEHWQQLRRHPDKTVAERAERLGQSGGASADMEEILAKLLPVARQRGDAVRGREVYQTACASCHVFNGEGGRIGPELTGIHARDRADILVDILDPNRSVEANYRLWVATTRDDETFSGRLEAETQTTVEILDITGEKHVIQRNDLAELDASPLSIMPTGFEALPPEDLAALLEYLVQTPHTAAER